MEELKACPYVESHSGIDGNGQEYISIVLEEPQIDARNLWFGGLNMVFENNHKKQRAEAYLSYWRNGVPQYIHAVRTWKGETLSEAECLKFATDYARKPEQEDKP
ncbi:MULTISPECIES: hypothetical protein [Caproicibacterium]|uniref:Uncharacterized protein n=1 Tax=Caproicibacterium argilliputei TaxID=3030016 RepID=A0AA97DCN4_9FIRM|nr:hypothetical protein [Caproicibacterium argilliputei]WOC33434.1 hypothetical protein PXC00_06100 [Caproicibacterium argilliputei]